MCCGGQVGTAGLPYAGGHSFEFWQKQPFFSQNFILINTGICRKKWADKGLKLSGKYVGKIQYTLFCNENTPAY